MNDSMNLDQDSPWAVLESLSLAANKFADDAVNLTGTGQDPNPPAVSFCGTDHASPMLVANSDPRFIGVMRPVRGNGMAELTDRAKSVLGDEMSAAQTAE